MGDLWRVFRVSSCGSCFGFVFFRRETDEDLGVGIFGLAIRVQRAGKTNQDEPTSWCRALSSTFRVSGSAHEEDNCSGSQGRRFPPVLLRQEGLHHMDPALRLQCLIRPIQGLKLQRLGSTRWAATLLSKVDLHHAIDFSAVSNKEMAPTAPQNRGERSA